MNSTDSHLLPVQNDLLAREPLFHRPLHACSIADFDRMLAPDYWEIGASGRRYSRVFILAHLATHPPVDASIAGWRVERPTCQLLAPALFLFTYTLHQGPRLSRRATLWQCPSPGTYQALFHQGTLAMADEEDTPPG